MHQFASEIFKEVKEEVKMFFLFVALSCYFSTHQSLFNVTFFVTVKNIPDIW